MKRPVERLEISMDEIEDILERAKIGPLTEEECAKLRKAFETLMYVTDLVGDKDTTIARLRKILFGASTEKIRNVLGGEGPQAADSAEETGAGVGRGNPLYAETMGPAHPFSPGSRGAPGQQCRREGLKESDIEPEKQLLL